MVRIILLAAACVLVSGCGMHIPGIQFYTDGEASGGGLLGRLGAGAVMAGTDATPCRAGEARAAERVIFTEPYGNRWGHNAHLKPYPHVAERHYEQVARSCARH